MNSVARVFSRSNSFNLYELSAWFWIVMQKLEKRAGIYCVIFHDVIEIVLVYRVGEGALSVASSL